MFTSLIKAAVKNPVLSNLLVILIIIGGYIGTKTMNKEVFPNFSMNLIEVSVAYPGADPDEIEEGICLKLESALEGIEGIKEISYEAKRNIGKALIECKNGADVFKVKDEVSSRIDAINNFPIESEKPIIRELKFKSDVLTLAIWGDLPEYQLKEFAVELKDRILLLDNVTYADVSGTKDYEISLEVPEENLIKYNINFNDIENAVRNNSLNQPAGEIKTGLEKANVRIEGRKYSAEEYSRIPVICTPEGEVITIGDIGKGKDTFDPENNSITRFNGKPAVLVIVYKAESEDAIKIATEVSKLLDDIKSQIPPQIHITKFKDYSGFIQSRLNLLINNGIIGFCIVIFILWLFLDIRLSFWITMGIPISIAGALAIMSMTGSSINMLTMFGLIMVLGLIVDDTIVIGESIYTRRESGDSSYDAAINGSSEVIMPVIAAALTTVIAFIPLFFIPGIMGKFIMQIPIPVVAALSVSIIEALFILPVHLRHLPEKNFGGNNFLSHISLKMRTFVNKSLSFIINGPYNRILNLSLNNYYIVIIISLALLLIFAGLFKGGFIKYFFMPEADSDFIYAKIELPPGTPSQSTIEISNKLLGALKKVEDEYTLRTAKELTIAQLYRVGTENNILNVEVELIPSEKRNWYYTNVLNAWKNEVGSIPGAFAVKYDSAKRGPGGNPIDIQLLGKDSVNLMAASNELIDKLQDIKGVIDPQSDMRSGMKEYVVKIKDSAYYYGVSISDIAQHIRGGLEGAEALKIQRGRDEIKVRVRYPEGQVNSIDYLKNLKIKTKYGDLVPLQSLVNITLHETQKVVKRKHQKRTVNVTADIDKSEANAQEVLDNLSSSFLPVLAQKYNLSYNLEGQAKESSQSFESLIRFGIPFALFAIYFIIASLFKSYLQPILILFTIPFGIIGSVLGHVIFGKDITIMSIFGMVAVAGIVINDSIVLIEAFNNNLEKGFTMKEALNLAGKRRFRAIILTTLTTFFGLSPLILEKSVQAQFLIPMAISISFGVLFSTIITLVAIPCYALMVNDIRRVFSYLFTGLLPSREKVEPRYEDPNRS
ncbi:MAG TPA: hypothetical protein DD381_14360 [Lentisphaeria bacterium]|nr:MAG: hypothetical protein A2X47_00910 [Lentisphaerae bacterium GWF2_38_69]HBM17508.1 hypothetical protein [Lentisphaeria bacterium]